MEEVFVRLFKRENVFSEYQGTLSTAKKKTKIMKHLHGKMVRKTKELRSEEAWGRIRKRYLKTGMEALRSITSIYNKLDRKKQKRCNGEGREMNQLPNQLLSAKSYHRESKSKSMIILRELCQNENYFVLIERLGGVMKNLKM